MFALGIEFLTGTAVMTAADSRDAAEWPLHPARAFMALVAAHYETRPLPDDVSTVKEDWAEEKTCLEWLERQAPPQLSYTSVPEENRRSVVKVFVPVNDASLPSNPAKVKPADMRSALGTLPTFRSRQERTFPSVSLGLDDAQNHVYLIWENAHLPSELENAFRRLSAKVIRIGHSSSLTRVWVADEATLPEPTLIPQTSPQKAKTSYKLRGISPGLLRDLDQWFNAEEINTFFEMGALVETSTGKAKVAAKTAFKARYQEEWRKTLAPPVRRSPSIGTSHHYVVPASQQTPTAVSFFDADMLILTKMEGRVLGLESTNLLIDALRGTLLVGSENKPEWFTGHRARSEKTTSPHLALFPLSYVSSEYADGHILGFALAFPRTVSTSERAAQLRDLFYTKEGEDKGLKLNLGDQGNWTLQQEDRSSPPIALKTQTWTEASNVWASVTPVVLDRHPKNDPRKPEEREAWRNEVAESIAISCANIGLPRPIHIDVDQTSWHRGAPRSRPGAGGMPWLASKTNSSRQQVHVLLQFDSEVQGPVLLGAGRYRGYGVCKPLGYAP